MKFNKHSESDCMLLCGEDGSVPYMQAGVVGEQSVVTQRHILLLPLLVKRFTASLQQHALQRNHSMIYFCTSVTGVIIVSWSL